MKNKNRGWQRILLLILPYILIVGLFQTIGFIVVGLDPMDFLLSKSSEQQLIITTFSLLGTLTVVWLFTRWVDKVRLIELGFHLKPKSGDFLLGLALGALTMGVGLLLLLVLGEIHVEQTQFSLAKIGITTLIFLLVSLEEEILFRGYILRNLMGSFNKYVALLVSALLFAGMHSLNPNISTVGMVNLFLAGILLGVTYIYTQNLWFPIALHFSWNLFQSWLGFNVSGQAAYSIIEFSIPNQNLINGGDFGFEGSIVATIIQLVLIAGLGFFYRLRMQPQEINSGTK